MGSVPWSNDAEKLAWYIERAKQSGEAVVRLERKLDAKDAEIARVMGDLEKLLKNGDLLCVQKVKLEREIEKRDALIKELADALNETHDTLQDLDFCSLCTLDETCSKGVDEDEDNPFECPRLNQIWSLIAKAREVIGSNRDKGVAAQDGEGK